MNTELNTDNKLKTIKILRINNKIIKKNNINKDLVKNENTGKNCNFNGEQCSKENTIENDGKVSLNIFLEKILIISSELSNGMNQLNKKFDDKMD